MNIAVIFAGGTGQRMGVKDVPKQFLNVNNKPVMVYTLEHFENHEEIDQIYVVCIKEWIDYLKYKLKEYDFKKIKAIIPGGKTGQDSIYLGLKEAQKNCTDDTIVLIHDGVRPLIDHDLISRNIRDVKRNGNSITCTGCNETFIISKDGVKVDDVPIRKESFNAQAPQGFRLGEIIAAHEKMRSFNPDYDNVIDSCTLYRLLGKQTYLTEGVRGNIKITNPVDMYILKAWLDFKENDGKVVGIPNLDDYFEYEKTMKLERRKKNCE